MRADKAQSLSKVIEEKLIDPLASQREIAERTGLSVWNVNDKLNELELSEIKDPRILLITNKDLSIVEVGQAEIDRRLRDEEEIKKMRTVEISQVLKESTSRYSLFKGSATDKDGWLKNTVATLSDLMS